MPAIRKRNRPAITRMNRADSQSPSGVLGVCRLYATRKAYSAIAEFQSPSGVLGVCRLPRLEALEADMEGTLKFQSPSGVLGVCRPPTCGHGYERLARAFQSPSGVLGVCRSGSRKRPGWCGCPTLPGLFIPRAF